MISNVPACTLAAALALLGCDGPPAGLAPSSATAGTETAPQRPPTSLRHEARRASSSPPAPHTREVTAAASAMVATPDPEAASFARVSKAEEISTAPPPGGFMVAARACLLDPSCTMERYAGLVFAASDAEDPKVPCLDLVRGSGVPIDLKRARACLVRSIAREGDCGGSSPSLERLQLALLVATGRGGLAARTTRARFS